MASFLQAGLLEDAAQRAGRNVYAWFAGHDDRARLYGLMMLTMASLLPSEQSCLGFEARD